MTSNKKDKLMYHKSVKTLYLNLLLPFRLTQFPLISSEKREHSVTKERALASNKTRETEKQRREGAEHCVHGRIKKTLHMRESRPKTQCAARVVFVIH
jgi:hypothetical protein